MDCYVTLPTRRARIADAPKCPACGTRLRVGSTAARVAYYYPACACDQAEPQKQVRPVDLEKLPHHVRRVLSLPTHDQP